MKTHENRALFSKALLKATTCLFLTAGAGVSSVWATPETTESMRTEMVQVLYLQPIITQYFIDNKSEIWLLFLIAHSKR